MEKDHYSMKKKLDYSINHAGETEVTTGKKFRLAFCIPPHSALKDTQKINIMKLR